MEDLLGRRGLSYLGRARMARMLSIRTGTGKSTGREKKSRNFRFGLLTYWGFLINYTDVQGWRGCRLDELPYLPGRSRYPAGPMSGPPWIRVCFATGKTVDSPTVVLRVLTRFFPRRIHLR